jgi:hypothetical protein
MSYRQRKARKQKILQKKISQYAQRKERISSRKSVEEIKRREALTNKISGMCLLDDTGKIPKTLLTSENLSTIKEAIKQLSISRISSSEDLSQEEYCKIFRAYIFKREDCDGRVCCQAITEDGKRCQRPASDFFTVDLTERSLVPKIPSFIEKVLTKEQVKELKLTGFAVTCCFYCWQHAAKYGAEMLTWYSNFSYYLTHPEEILEIFYEDVRVVKKSFFNPLSYQFNVSNLRSPDEIIKNMFIMTAKITGKMTYFYWVIMAMVWLYDYLKDKLVEVLYGDRRENIKEVENMAITSALTLLKFNDLDKDVLNKVH